MADEQLKQEIEKFVEHEWENIVADIATLVEVNSVEDLAHAAPGSPFGPGPREALDRALAIARRIGLSCDDGEGYIGIADLPGRSHKQLAMIAHADIVPVGVGWDSDPLTLTRREGCMLGRGVADDKGPLVLELYAAKFFADRGEELPYTLRCLIGCNEETSMADVAWYLKHYEQPAALFTPDADFPVCYGEKGTFHATIRSAAMPSGGRILAMDGGTVENAVPGEATATVAADAAELPAAEHISITAASDGRATLVAHGKGGHASKPEGTTNAIALLVDYLLANDLAMPDERQFLLFEQQLLASTDGSSVGCTATDDVFDPLTMIGGTIHLVDGHFEQTVDSRFPTSITGAEIAERLGTLAAEHGAELGEAEIREPYVTDPTSPFIQTLISAYADYATGDTAPFTMGGGTYARHFANAASFGPGDPSWPRPAWCGGEHGPNEGTPEDKFQRALKVYILAIARLMQTEL